MMICYHIDRAPFFLHDSTHIGTTKDKRVTTTSDWTAYFLASTFSKIQIQLILTVKKCTLTSPMIFYFKLVTSSRNTYRVIFLHTTLKTHNKQLFYDCIMIEHA